MYWSIHQRFGKIMIVEAILLALTIISVVGLILPTANTQASNELDSLTVAKLQAFTKLAIVYSSGGQAPALVDELNKALNLVQEAKIAESNGNATEATNFENQARSLISDVLARAPLAQLQAQHEAFNRVLFLVASIPVVVVISTATFYLGLRTWTWYEKMKFLEMKIVENDEE
ncbi:MAG TPA: hypothetical protein VJZ75_10030 [Candidatus Bathyarchaeia archaeon]|nr:hypothetical protein [Candidatus Bathyarchaeia archaeon]